MSAAGAQSVVTSDEIELAAHLRRPNRRHLFVAPAAGIGLNAFDGESIDRKTIRIEESPWVEEVEIVFEQFSDGSEIVLVLVPPAEADSSVEVEPEEADEVHEQVLAIFADAQETAGERNLTVPRCVPRHIVRRGLMRPSDDCFSYEEL